ncbi:MAG: DUF1573 domain-containing protein [Spirochaetales bacterium]|nr:DUF1573 domain-containing protein [Spirochaetales bacterium]
MLKNIFHSIVIIIIFCFLCLWGCEKEPYAIKFEKETIDIGTVEGGINVDVVFRFRNTGKETIEIKVVRPTCGCTAPGDWDQTVKSGKTGEIPVTYNTEVLEGEVSRVIFIDTNIPGRESIPLVIKGEIHNPIIIPAKTYFLGKILNENETLHGSYMIKYYLDTPFKVSEIVLPDENTTARVVTVEPLKEYRLDFTVHPPLVKYEFITKKIVFKVGGKVNNEYELFYSYLVPTPVEVNPQNIELDMEKIKIERIEWRINIKSNIEEPIEILDLNFDGSGVKYSVTALREKMFLQIPLVFPMGFSFPEDKKIFHLTFKVKNDPLDLLYTITIQEKKT